MIAFWVGLPLAIRLLTLAIAGACAGALANCVLYACSNVVRLINPWAPQPQETDAAQHRADAKREFPYSPRGPLDRVPIWGWVKLKRESDSKQRVAWIGPLLVEVLAAILLPLAYWCEVKAGGLVPELIASWIELPLTVRYAVLAVDGLIGGVIVNYVIYTQASYPRQIDPWAPAPENVSPRRRSDRIPIIGWLGLRREADVHGSGFWVRPMLIEIGTCLAMPALYWYETQVGGFLPTTFGQNRPFLDLYEPVATQIFIAHGLLMLLMISATFIDFDEQTIPDFITVTGTIAALIFATVVFSNPVTLQFGIAGFMPTARPICETPGFISPTTFDSPWFTSPINASKWATATGLWTAGAIWTVWCFALADRRFTRRMIRRRGLTKAIEFFFAVLFRHWSWKLIVALWAVGLGGIATIWSVGGDPWHGLFSALVGLGVGGGTIWAIRIVASWAMDMEAMGFGDVTLMSMVGAFIGWQGALAAFFLAPFAAIVIVLIQYIVTRNRHVPFGPYLCAGTALTIIFWDDVYNLWLSCNLSMLWSMLLWLAIACLGLMGVMLFVMRLVRTAFSPRG